MNHQDSRALILLLVSSIIQSIISRPIDFNDSFNQLDHRIVLHIEKDISLLVQYAWILPLQLVANINSPNCPGLPLTFVVNEIPRSPEAKLFVSTLEDLILKFLFLGESVFNLSFVYPLFSENEVTSKMLDDQIFENLLP